MATTSFPSGVVVHTDGLNDVSPEHQKLFEDFGVLVYSIIANMEQQESDYEDYLWWEANSPLRGARDEDDEEIDLGPEEPDEYGGD